MKHIKYHCSSPLIESLQLVFLSKSNLALAVLHLHRCNGLSPVVPSRLLSAVASHGARGLGLMIFGFAGFQHQLS